MQLPRQAVARGATSHIPSSTDVYRKITISATARLILMKFGTVVYRSPPAPIGS